MDHVLEIVTLADENIDRLLADPPLVWRLVAPDDPSLYEGARLESRSGGLLGRVFGGGGRNDEGDAGELELTPPEGQKLDLGRAWLGVHYLLTGTADGGEPPIDLLVRGGETVGDVEVGHGPARALRAANVAKASEALAGVDPAALEARFDAEDMIEKDIPGSFDDYVENDARPLIERFEQLRDFVGAAAEAECGLVFLLT